MPRQDVPYGGAICRLKERIAEIWDELGKKLHSINGVEGDAAGDVKIVSGDAAVVVTSDQVNHEIEIALDSSQLPAASVSSVNGQTGVVVLDGDDIELINGAGVTAANAIITNGQRLATLQGDLNTEISDRQTADAALQGNINTVQASIPTAAATAVANDPTVAQLATDVPNKLNKIVSGSTLKAYTHTGASQGETAVSSGTDANSIGLRDADGRMHGADPANGATDRSLVTANWVSQTGDSSPNNLVHKTGSETIAASKTFAANPHIKKTDPSYTELILDDNVTRDTAPNVTHRFGLRVQDSNSTSKAALSVWNQSDGSVWLVMEAYPIINGIATYRRKEILKFNPDGTITVMT